MKIFPNKSAEIFQKTPFPEFFLHVLQKNFEWIFCLQDKGRGEKSFWDYEWNYFLLKLD